jgi:hypothetical protein
VADAGGVAAAGEVGTAAGEIVAAEGEAESVADVLLGATEFG